MIRRGSGPKPSRLADAVSVTYSPSRWSLLKSIREKTVHILELLGTWGSGAVVHGSVARGDVDEESDIDILLASNLSTQLVEAKLASSGLYPYSREISQATPSHSPKAHIYLDPEQSACITIPLSQFRKLELEFYKFGGTVTLRDLLEDRRRPGCTKKLTLVEPTDQGHVESPIIGRESEVARLLGVSIDIVKERVRVLTRRDSVGRTGIFLKMIVPDAQSFEGALQKEADANPALRRTLSKREGSLKR